MDSIRRFFRRWRPPSRAIAELQPGSRDVEVRGIVAALSELRDPLHGQSAVAIHYRASVSGTVSGITGSATDHRLEAQQATDFLITDDSGTARVCVDPGQDVERIHEHALARHGAAMLVEVDCLRPGMRARVRGRVIESMAGSPHRRTHTIVIEADDFGVDEGES